MKLADTKTDTAVEKPVPVFSDQQLEDIKSFDDAMAVLADAGINATEITDYGTGFSVVDKSTLVNVPFVILSYKFAEGDYENDFAIVQVVTKDNRKCLITDGSTGIRDQVKGLQRRGVIGGVVCPKGLTVSEYTYVDSEGKTKPARTFYLSM